MDPEMQLIPLHLRLVIYGTGARDGVDTQKYNTNMDPEMELNHCPLKKLTSLCYSYGDKNLRVQYLQKCIISNSATHNWHTCEKDKKIDFTAEY